jgi:hypothetical protein
VVVNALRQTLREQLKSYGEETGHDPDVGDGTRLRWREKPSGKGREWGQFPPDDPAVAAASEDAIVASMEAELARQKAGSR